MKKIIFKIEILTKESNLIDAIKLANEFFSESEYKVNASKVIKRLRLEAHAINRVEPSYNVALKKNKRGQYNKIILEERSRYETDVTDNALRPRLIKKPRFIKLKNN